MHRIHGKQNTRMPILVDNKMPIDTAVLCVIVSLLFSFLEK